MKLFVWLLAASLAVFCVTCFIELAWLSHFLAHGWPHDLPAFTEMLTAWPFWPLFVPLPWLVWVVLLNRNKDPSVSAVLRFAGTVGLAAAVMFFAVLVGSLLPFTFMGNRLQ